MHKDPPARSFGALLKQYRRAAGFTQAALAEQAGYSTVYIGKLEEGDRWPLGQTVDVLGDALHLMTDERATFEAAARQRPSTRHMRRILRDAKSRATGLTPLVGRGAEQDVLRRHLGGEGPPVLLLVGEPGIGKTRLLEEAIGWGQAQGWQVLVGGCHSSSSQEPYAPVSEALVQNLLQRSPSDQERVLDGCNWLARLFPELVEQGRLAPPAWSIAPDQERRLLFAAVGRFLAQAASSVGTLLVLDDLHWAGMDALDLLTSLVRSPGGAPSVRLLGAYRETEVRANAQLANWLAELARMGVVEPLQVPPLPPAEAAALLRTLLADRAAAGEAALEERILQRAGGVPYFLVSYAQDMRPGALQEGAAATIGEVPWSVAETIRHRMMTLPETARYLLGVVSIAGPETPRALLLGLATQLGWGRLEVLEAVERACQARLLEELQVGIYRFPHDLIREVVEADLSGLRRVILHQQVAEILEQQPGEALVERLAYHFTLGEQPEKAISYLEQAGDRAASMYAHAEAEQAYRRLLELATPLGRETVVAAAQEKLATVLRVVGRYPEALELLEAARTTYEAAHDLEALARVLGKLGQLHAARGAAEVGIALLDPWLATLQPGAIPAEQQGWLTLTLAYLSLNSSRPNEALAAAERAADCALRAHDDRLAGQALWHTGRSLLLLNRLDEAVQRFEAALPLAEGAGDVYSLYYIHLNLALISHSHGDYHDSLEHGQQATTLAEQMGNPFLLAQVLGTYAHCVWSQGKWQQSRQEYERAIALMRQIGMPWGATYSLLNFGLQLLGEGEEEAGREALEEAIDLARGSQDRQAEREAESILANYDLFCGRPERALKRLRPLMEEAEMEDGSAIACLPVLARAYLDVGDAGQAQRLIEEALARLRARKMRAALAEALQVQVRISAHGRRWREAERALAEALQLARAMPCPYDEAKALFIAGQVCLQRGQAARARQQFEQAWCLLELLGEQPYARQAEQALATLTQ